MQRLPFPEGGLMCCDKVKAAERFEKHAMKPRNNALRGEVAGLVGSPISGGRSCGLGRLFRFLAVEDAGLVVIQRSLLSRITWIWRSFWQNPDRRSRWSLWSGLVTVKIRSGADKGRGVAKPSVVIKP
jgi:hypothetical protein